MPPLEPPAPVPPGRMPPPHAAIAIPPSAHASQAIEPRRCPPIPLTNTNSAGLTKAVVGTPSSVATNGRFLNG